MQPIPINGPRFEQCAALFAHGGALSLCSMSLLTTFGSNEEDERFRSLEASEKDQDVVANEMTPSNEPSSVARDDIEDCTP